MKKQMSLLVGLLIVLIALLSTIFVANVVSTPIYSCNARVTDEGLQDDNIYHFPNGDSLNPQVGEPLLLLNGSFSTKATGFISTGSPSSVNAYVPISEIVKAFGGSSSWDANKKEAIFKSNDITMNIILSKYNVVETATLNGESCELPIYENGRFYVDLSFINKFMNLDAGYLNTPGSMIADNPVIWVDRPGTYQLYTKAGGETLNWLKTQLNQGLENFKTTKSDNKTPEMAQSVASKIAFDIKNTNYIGQLGRYALYNGVSRMILVDTTTKDIYFYDAENAYGNITKVDLNDPNLYSMHYLFG